jgi:hypothetical protein
MNLNDDTMKNVELSRTKEFFDGNGNQIASMTIRGRGTDEVTFPEELALGNIVKLNEPYPIGTEEFEHSGSRRKLYATYGIIAEQVSWAASGNPIVSLYLYSDKGQMYMGPNNIPTFVDYPYVPDAEYSFAIHKIATKIGYLTEEKSE